MRDIDPSPDYSQGNEAEFRSEVNKDLNSTYKRSQDVFIETTQRFCLQSPNGLWWRLEVDDLGALVPTEVIP